MILSLSDNVREIKSYHILHPEIMNDRVELIRSMKCVVRTETKQEVEMCWRAIARLELGKETLDLMITKRFKAMSRIGDGFF